MFSRSFCFFAASLKASVKVLVLRPQTGGAGCAVAKAGSKSVSISRQERIARRIVVPPLKRLPLSPNPPVPRKHFRND
jgi:hypothetical protein